MTYDQPALIPDEQCQGCALSPTLLICIIDYPGVQVRANFHVSDLAYTDDIEILSSSYREMQGLLAATPLQSASETKVSSAKPSRDQNQD